MAKIDIRRQHSLDKRTVVETVLGLAEDFGHKHGVEFHHQGDEVLLEGSGIDGRITLADSEIRIEATLTAPLSFIAPLIRGSVERHLDEWLEASDPPSAT